MRDLRGAIGCQCGHKFGVNMFRGQWKTEDSRTVGSAEGTMPEGQAKGLLIPPLYPICLAVAPSSG